MKKIIRLLFAGLFVLLAACYVAGHALLYLNSADGDTAWRSEIEPWLGPQPQKVAYDNDEFGERWLLKADAAWVQRAAQDLHAEPYSLERTIDCREEDYCQGHAVKQRYRTKLPTQLYRAGKSQPIRVMKAVDLWELEDGYVFFDWKDCSLHDYFDNIPLSSYSWKLGVEAAELIRRGGVTDLQSNPVLPENAPAVQTACVLVPGREDAEEGAKPVLVPTEALVAKYTPARGPWWMAGELQLLYFITLLFAPAVLVDGVWLWIHRRMPQIVREYAEWFLCPLVTVVPFSVSAFTVVADAPFGILLVPFLCGFFCALQLLISLMLLPLGKLFCRMVR